MKSKFNILFLLIIVITSGRNFAQVSHEEIFKKASGLYSNGNYKEALDEWMSVYNSGIRSANLDYNIGNANFKLNNIPGAVLFFERALLLKPGDEDIQYNLQISRTLVVDKFVEIPELFFVRGYDFISLTLWAKISIACFILFLTALSVYIYSTTYHLKVAGFWLAIMLLFFSVCSFTSAVRNKNLIYHNPKAIIFSPLVNGKSSPDNSGTDLFVIHDGTKVTIEDEVGVWYEIRLSDGNKGWVPANSVEKI